MKKKSVKRVKGMNVKRFIFASIAVYVLFEILGFVIHGVVLKNAYVSLSSIWRPDMCSKQWIICAGDLVRAFLFTFIFIKGYKNRGMIEGLRFGIIIGLFASIPAFYMYVMLPLPFVIALGWFIFWMVSFILCGILAALIYKPKQA